MPGAIQVRHAASVEAPHFGEPPVASGELLHHQMLRGGLRLELLREAGDDRIELGAPLVAIDLSS